jgi:hypothetical protein
LKMAKLNNRHFIGVDINEEYLELSKKRIDSIVSYTSDYTNPKEVYIPVKKVSVPKKKKSIKSKIEDDSYLGIWANRGLRRVA